MEDYSTLILSAVDRYTAQNGNFDFKMTVYFQRATGQVQVSFKRRGSHTVLDDLFQSGSGKVRMVRPEQGRIYEAVLINTSGGMTDGDRYEAKLGWGEGTTATASTQAAERYYQSLGEDASVVTTIDVSENASAFWLPQETIMFDGAAYRRETLVNLRQTSNFIGIESSIFGRAAMGEIVSQGRLREKWQIRIDDRLMFADAFSLEGNIDQLLTKKSVANGALAISTLIYKGPDMSEMRDRVNEMVAQSEAIGGATCVGPIMVVRLFAPNSQLLRNVSAAIVDAFLACVVHTGSTHSLLPRVWSL